MSVLCLVSLPFFSKRGQFQNGFVWKHGSKKKGCLRKNRQEARRGSKERDNVWRIRESMTGGYAMLMGTNAVEKEPWTSHHTIHRV